MFYILSFIYIVSLRFLIFNTLPFFRYANRDLKVCFPLPFRCVFGDVLVCKPCPQGVFSVTFIFAFCYLYLFISLLLYLHSVTFTPFFRCFR